MTPLIGEFGGDGQGFWWQAVKFEGSASRQTRLHMVVEDVSVFCRDTAVLFK